jgi:AcrR family transcriptional regulator
VGRLLIRRLQVRILPGAPPFTSALDAHFGYHLIGHVDHQTPHPPLPLPPAPTHRRPDPPGLLDAARALFVHQGYVATTIDQIAEAAGVSKPTVFASVGNKRAIIKQLRDLAIAGDEEPVALAERLWFTQALDEPDPRRSLRLHARNIVRLHQSAADLAEVLRSGAGADPELRALWQIAEAERRVDAGTIIDALLHRAPLKAGLDREGPLISFGSSPAPTTSNDSCGHEPGAPSAMNTGSPRPSSTSSCHPTTSTPSKPGHPPSSAP